MALLHSCLVARVRRPVEGEPAHVTLAESNGISGGGTASAPVVAAYQALLGSAAEAVEARRRYSHCVLIVDNGMRANHEFPDLDAAAVRREQVEATRAAGAAVRQSESEVADLERRLAAAKAGHSAAAARLANLTGAPVDSDSDSTPEEGQGEDGADPQGGTPPTDPPTGQDKKEAPAASAPSGGGNTQEPDPAEKMAARLEAGDPVTADDLSALTVPELKALAVRYGLAVPGDAKKGDLIDLVLSDEEEG